MRQGVLVVFLRGLSDCSPVCWEGRKEGREEGIRTPRRDVRSERGRKSYEEKERSVLELIVCV